MNRQKNGMMKKIFIIILLLECNTWVNLSAQTKSDTLLLGYGFGLSKSESAFTANGINRDALGDATQIDMTKTIYGRIAGLRVSQGIGPSADNTSTLSLHGHSPLVLIDGYARDLKNITVNEIANITVISDAVASALYGVRGANGIVMITTKRGGGGKLKVGVTYQYGLNTQFRSPEFADSYTYASALNSALINDGLEIRYNKNELDAFRSGEYPKQYPNVDWWNEVYNKTASNHRFGLTFEGSSKRFRYYSVVDYMHDRALFRSNEKEQRYDSNPTDIRLNVRTNLDVDISPTTVMRLGIAGNISERNLAQFGNIYNALYRTPSAAFPVRYDDGIYGGSSIYGNNNPVALLMDSGNYKTTTTTVMADIALCQDLGMIVKGLSAEVSASFDNVGAMYDSSGKEYRYKNEQPYIATDGTLITNPVIYGQDSETLQHGQGFYSLSMTSEFNGKLTYNLHQERHDFTSAIIYNQRSYVANGRNVSNRNQSLQAVASYTFDKRYAIGVVGNYSGSAYLPPKSNRHFYPAANIAWIVSGEDFMSNLKNLNMLKVSASYGASAWDGSLSHELFRQSYGSTNAGSYYFTNSITSFGGKAEGNLPVENLIPEKSVKTTFGIELSAFNNRLDASVNGFIEERTNILVAAAPSISGVIGIGVGQQATGKNQYRGVDASIAWNVHQEKFSYGIYANGSYLTSKVINENQEYQQYDYLYHTGNRVGQRYGLEVIGIFQSQMEINNSPNQTFSTVRPGDLKYKDQNGDNIIDDRDVVKMYESSTPRFYFGFGFTLRYRQIELSADFQGVTGVTINMLDSPLYTPLVNNGNLSQTLLDNETPWSADKISDATIPRLTTLENANNYRNNSLWYRDGSFLKLRKLGVSYTLPKRLVHIADMKVYFEGNNLFCLDGIKTVDPEQLTATYPSVRTFFIGVKFNF